MRLGGPIIWYTFLLVLAYLLLVHWRGANALAGTGFRGYGTVVEVLQGRTPGGRAIR
jgi:hypothetical protein